MNAIVCSYSNIIGFAICTNPKKKSRKSMSDQLSTINDLKYKTTLKKRSWHKKNVTDRKEFGKNSMALKQSIIKAKKDYEQDLSRQANKNTSIPVN